MSDNVTQIDTTYLNKLKGQIDLLESEVEAELKGVGPSNSPNTTNFINPLNDLILLAGRPGFNVGVAISNAMQNAGNSVYSQLQWLSKVRKDMSLEITATVNLLNGTENLNNDAVDKLIKDFQSTISDMNNPPSGSNPNTLNAS